ncbi:TfoX/Sxy family protein [Methanolobus sp. ZRKC3]|uniref:TfoX/Sxy family protein n=1 Tax=Methanolobus sp. ZRKC3 TaxID=3125786 RepID=UPI00324E1F53
MAWKKPSDELISVLEESMDGRLVEPRKMFGCPVYFVNRNMYAGVHGDGFMLRLTPEDQKKLFEKHDETAPFEPMGRRMKEYIILPPDVYDNKKELDKWLNISYDYVATLPLKEKKKTKK